MKILKQILKTLLLYNLLKSYCVVSQIRPSNLNGVSTTTSQVPYLVQILEIEQLICGGTLVSTFFVVTTARCVYSKDTYDLYILAGHYENGVRSRVRKVIIPRIYTDDSFRWDVAVLKSVNPIAGRNIQPIAMCTDAFNLNDDVRVYGWGLVKQVHNANPYQLRTATAKLMNVSQCLLRYKSNRTMFCVVLPHPKDGCLGYGGGPAIIKGKFCGIALSGYSCNNYFFSGIYTNILWTGSFIINAIGKLSVIRN